MSTTTTPTTLNQIVENLRDIARNHYQINNFGYYSNASDFYQSGTTNSPEMWCTCMSVTVDPQSGMPIYTINIIIADNVKRGQVNELEVESDLILIAQDVIAQVRHPSYRWNVTQTSNITLPSEKTPKNLTYAEFQVAIRVPKPNNRCAIPFSTNPITT